MKVLFVQSRRSYGSRRLMKALCKEGFKLALQSQGDRQVQHLSCFNCNLGELSDGSRLDLPQS